MPVILAPHDWPAWLRESPAEPQQLKSLLPPYPVKDMVAGPVDKRVGNVNKDPALIEPPAAT